MTTTAATSGKSLTFRIQPLTGAENSNARNVPGYAPSFRRTLKVRLRFTGQPTPFRALHIYGDSYWNERTINIQTGLDGHTPQAVSATAYNGFVAGKTPFESRPPGTQLKVLYTEHPLGSSNRTILTLHGGAEDFGVSIDDLIERKAIYVKAFGIFLGDAAVGEDFAAYRDSGASQPGEDIMSRVSRHPEQTLDQALAKYPAWPSAPGKDPIIAFGLLRWDFCHRPARNTD